LNLSLSIILLNYLFKASSSGVISRSLIISDYLTLVGAVALTALTGVISLNLDNL